MITHASSRSSRALCPLPMGLAAGGASKPAGPPSAEALFRRELCGSCHGSAGKGSWMGPPLRGLSEHWDRDSLQEFLRDPAGRLATDERLSKLSREFPNPMAANRVLGKAERLQLADWLLQR